MAENDTIVPARISRTREFYLTRAYAKAFGNRDASDGLVGQAAQDPRGFRQGEEAAWDPQLGYKANRPRILKLYEYYMNTYLAHPNQFLWAGLGKMAGSAVLGGLDAFVKGPFSDPTPTTQIMVRIGKEIFHDLAWQHEAFLDDFRIAIALAEEHDKLHPAKKSYAEAWRNIQTGDERKVAEGNQTLLEIEQFTIIQPRYDQIKSEEGTLIFGRTRAFTSNIHPYHREFLTVLPRGDVTIANDRWNWITEQPHGMWAKWAERHPEWGSIQKMSSFERDRLVQLPMDRLIKQDWQPVVRELLFPGSP